MFKLSSLPAALLICILAILPVPAYALSALSISSPAADGVFVLQGAGIEGVSGLDITVSYDLTTLSNPRVEIGKPVRGMLNAVNPGNPIKMLIVSATKTITESGTIATMTFDRVGDSLGKITGLTATLINLDNKKVAMAQPVVINPTEVRNPDQQTGNTDTSDTDTGNSGTGSTTTRQPFVVGGTLTLASNGTTDDGQSEPPSVEVPPLENPEQQPAEGAIPEPEPQVPAPSAEEAQEPAPVQPEPEPEPEPESAVQPAPEGTFQPAASSLAVQSVLERFRLFQGERTLESLTALFRREGATFFSQTPPIGIADGKSSVKLLIRQVAGDKTPIFAFNSSRFVSLAKTGDAEWEVEVRPNKGAVRSSVTMRSGDVVQVLPLTVTPRADTALTGSGETTEADFRLFLKERGAESAPRYDLNGDGTRDYVDDYIFTANYLLKVQEKAGNKKTAPQTPR